MAKKVYDYKELPKLAVRLRDDLKESDFVLLYAHNGTGKTRLSYDFKERGKKGRNKIPDTLYFNAYTEDLFSWDNDIINDTNRVLKINSASRFFSGFQQLELDNRIRPLLSRYADFDFVINYEDWQISFSRNVRVKKLEDGEMRESTEVKSNIKVSRGEENMFIWCVFLAICQLAIDGAEAYNWVKYFYIDDPISSLDDNNAIAVASDLSQLLLQAEGKIKVVISSHHILFFNVVCNEIKKKPHEKYFLYKKPDQSYSLRKTTDTPYFHHVALLSELKQATASGNIKTYHFNTLRSILEKTSSFFGFNDFGKCIYEVEDQVLFERALNLLSHGKYSIYEPVDMSEDNKELFKRILSAFLEKHQFELPELLQDNTVQKA
ncbi:wobble nucleotide-excising tRNase [Pedobacter sp. W3I1]|uniref:AAA family ATPase n=1 Tax=Pedobacter sp. W3I1 TaxID=3042291 RepID=UPI0027822D6D|nr:AAA family ATPase [Pedobacter sp. W3I1]MDQ0640116.1 wobble nucleotide-excising tRNase [Pedobacter sp. W3I1]